MFISFKKIECLSELSNWNSKDMHVVTLSGKMTGVLSSFASQILWNNLMSHTKPN